MRRRGRPPRRRQARSRQMTCAPGCVSSHDSKVAASRSGSRSTASPVPMSTSTVPYTCPLRSAKSSTPRISGAAVTCGSGSAMTRRSTVDGCTAMPSVQASRAAALPGQLQAEPGQHAQQRHAPPPVPLGEPAGLFGERDRRALILQAAEPAHRQRDQQRAAARRAVGHRPRVPAVHPR